MDLKGVAVIVQNQDGNFLLHLRDSNTTRMTNEWCLIGGTLDLQEDSLEGACREVKEETNLTLNQPCYLHDFPYNGKQIALVAGNVDSHEESLIVGEGADLQFFTKAEALELINSLDYTNPYLEQLTDYLKNH